MHIVTAKEMYDMDRYAMEEIGLDGRLLMENAGRAIADRIQPSISRDDSILVLVGKGNNGGDGFVIARTLKQRGYDVEVLQTASSSDIQGDAAYHRDLYLKMGYPLQEYENTDQLSKLFQTKRVWIDAMLGIGVKGKLRPPFHELVPWLNHFHPYLISVDLPSGMPADEGVEVDQAIQADRTIVIQYPKTTAFVQHTAPFYGAWETVDIGLPYRDPGNKRERWGLQDVKSSLPPRDPFSHKGTHGKGLVIGGSMEMPGSIAMTARAALRAGSGLLTIATVKEAIAAIAPTVLEATYLPLEAKDGRIAKANELDCSSDAIAIGMGMGRHEDAQSLLLVVLENASGDVLIDADGIYALKEYLPLLAKRKANTILTPHPGEMAHLVGMSISEVLSRPFSITREFAVTHEVFVVFKSAFTIISTPSGDQWVTDTGNPGLAKGGSGDVLSGILLAMLMQSQTVQEALCNGTWIHGYSADVLVENDHSTYDLVATDLLNGLSSVYRTLSDS